MSVLAVVPIVICMILSLANVPVLGFDWVHPSKEAKKKELIAVETIDFKSTPAQSVSDRFYAALDAKWAPTGVKIESSGLPQPFDCVTPSPTLSTSRFYNNSQSEFQVSFAAYPAGLAGKQLQNIVDNVEKCKNSNTTLSNKTTLTGLNTDAGAYSASWPAGSVGLFYFRLGDVIVFLTTPYGFDGVPQLKMLKTILEEFLTDDVCPVRHYEADVYRRNAFYAPKDFTGLLQPKTLTTEKVSVPTLPQELKDAGVSETSLPASEIKLKEVKLPVANGNHPMWPNLPKFVPKPKLPDLPREQKLSNVAMLRIDDPVGPGCGWAFLGNVKPNFNKIAVDENNKRNVESAQKYLDGDGSRWQNDVIQYWVQYKKYLNTIVAYEEYREKVRTVAEAWAVINAQWESYYSEYAKWKERDAARLTFISNQEAAQAKYDTEAQECANYPAQVAAWRTEYHAAVISHDDWRIKHDQWEKDMQNFNANYPAMKAQYDAAMTAWYNSGQVGPQPVQPAPPIEPVEPTIPSKPMLNHPCPPTRPTILDQAPPRAEKPPRPPADPRPVSAR